MKARAVYGSGEPAGGFTTVDGEAYYRIAAYHRLPPFLMSMASDSDLWMFISSSGGLTAGRVDPNCSLFPYETADKLHDGHHHTGPLTVVRVRRKGRADVLWSPFSERSLDDFHVERNLYKNAIGNRLIFEEVNHDLDIAFQYRWSACDALGWVRTATLTNRSSRAIALVVLDGLRNILPYGVTLALQQRSSCLADAYKRSECDPETRLGIFALTSKITDRPEPAEELRANTVWCHGLGSYDVYLSGDAVSAFRRNAPLPRESVLTGRRGNYLVTAPLELEANGSANWHLVADVGRSHAQVAKQRLRLLRPADLDREIERELGDADDGLRHTVGSADGIQLTGDAEAVVHHFANVLFNNMRGGVFAQSADHPKADWIDFVRTRNRLVAERHADFFADLTDAIPMHELLARSRRTGDADLQRLAYEYLPLWFSRRHGDPSRPWNRFSIRVRNSDGSRALRYEGNWRDIFQNWEALGTSFPGFIPHFIAKFVNASTVDGFNPYRITRDGVDWEIADPSDPWSHIGYWGDHQIVYLLKFLEALPRFSPGVLEDLLEREIFSYTDVPYRIAPYRDLLDDPRATIAYDREAAARIDERLRRLGTDGKLLPDRAGAIDHVNLLEKLLVPTLAKLSNLVPDAGIWMNTQRPEWNDANNALAGSGLSMVTLCYLRRYLCFMQRLLEPQQETQASISIEVILWLRRLRSILEEERAVLDAGTCSDADRKRILDSLGGAFSAYRDQVYSGGFSGKGRLAVGEIVALCQVGLRYLDHAIQVNRRPDGLYHAYNLLEIANDRGEAHVHPLYEMLEGQVAALSSGVVDAREALHIVSKLFESRLYREDRHSFLLYPERELPGFLAKNAVPDSRVEAVPLLRSLLESGETSIVERDAMNVVRFHADFRNARDLSMALDRLTEQLEWSEQVVQDRRAILDIFEQVFDHHGFTGRSGTMYGYEGLGSVYWHMVSKLLLAVQEITLRAAREGQPARIVDDLKQQYYRIRSGLGFETTAAAYGAFPMDPYSHTPAYGGAQQPGMTGQVKEEILTRLGELGVVVEQGRVAFRPVLLRRLEFLREPGSYHHYDIRGNARSFEVPAGGLAFSFCQVPIVYQLCDVDAWIRITESDGMSSTLAGDRLDAACSRKIFERAGVLAKIEVGVPERVLCRLASTRRDDPS